jgi:hypothetical protein
MDSMTDKLNNSVARAVAVKNEAVKHKYSGNISPQIGCLIEVGADLHDHKRLYNTARTRQHLFRTF